MLFRSGDVATLQANFSKIEAFWAGRKVDDAVTFAKNGAKALADLDAWRLAPAAHA